MLMEYRRNKIYLQQNYIYIYTKQKSYIYYSQTNKQIKIHSIIIFEKWMKKVL